MKGLIKFKFYHIQVFLILMLALVLCSFLGGNCGTTEGMENSHTHDNISSKNNLLQDPDESKNDTVQYSTIKSRKGMKNQMNNDSLNGTENKETNELNKPSTSIAAIPKSSIPSGSEDLYVLRSEVASLLNKPSVPPCPPCGRCPEPSFSCKKVPNYNNVHSENNYLPKPVLSDFSTFAM